MKLDRNINPDGRGKYALVNLRALHGEGVPQEYREWFNNLVAVGLVTLGNETPESQFFVIKHKDAFAPNALRAYEAAARAQAHFARARKEDDLAESLYEYADEIRKDLEACLTVTRKLPD